MAIITNLQYFYFTKSVAEKKEFRDKVKTEIGIAKETFYKYLRGEVNPPKLTIEKLGELTGINPKKLNDEYYRTVQTKI